MLVFDRFGKLITNSSQDRPSWDGTFQGENLPPGNYWYRITVEDLEFKGAFVLKR